MKKVVENIIDTGFCGLIVSLGDIKRALRISRVSDSTTSLTGDASFDILRNNEKCGYDYEAMNAFALKYGLPTIAQRSHK